MDNRHARPDDRRSRRTRRTLGEALTALMLEKRYDRITVQEIIDRADVGRSTFYAHFLDKEDLLQHEVAAVVEALGRHMDSDAGGARIVPSIELFRHLRESRPLIQALVRGGAMDTVLKTMHSQLSSHIEARLARRQSAGASPGIPLPLVAHFVASVLLSMFEWWQASEMRAAPEEIDAYFLQLVRPAVREAIGVDI